MRRPLIVGACALVALGLVGLGGWRVIAERDRADAESRAATVARTRADQLADRLRLVEARDALETDPTRALQAIAQIADPKLSSEVRMIAADARARGVARVFDNGGRVAGLAISPDGHTLVAGGTDHRIRMWTIGDPSAPPRSVDAGAVVRDLVATADAILSIDATGEVRRWVGTTSTIVRPAAATPVAVAAFAPGGARIAVRRDGIPSAELWDLATATGAIDLAEPYDRFAWAPDGSAFAAYRAHDYDATGELALIDPATGKPKQHWDRLSPTAFATDGKRVIVGTFGGTAEILDARPTLVQHAGPITSLLLLADGRLASASSDVELVYDEHATERKFAAGDYLVKLVPSDPLTHFEHRAVELRGHRQDIDALAVAGGGANLVLASAGRDGAIRVWSVPPVDELDPHTGAVSAGASFAFVRPGGQLVMAEHEVGVASLATRAYHTLESPLARGWDSAGSGKFHIEYVNGKPITIIDTALDAETSMIADLAVATDPRSFVTLDFLGGAAIRWDGERGRALADTIRMIAISDDGARVATVSPDEIATWDASDVKAALGKPRLLVHAVAVAPDGTVAVAYPGGGVELLAAGRPARALVGQPDHLRVLAFTRDGKALVGGGDAGVLRRWDLATGAATHRSGHTGAIVLLGVAPDGSTVTTSTDGTLRIWPATGEPTILRGHAGRIATFAFRADHQALLTGGDDDTVRAWDLASGASRIVLHLPSRVTCVAYLADGRVLGVDHLGDVRAAPGE